MAIDKKLIHFNTKDVFDQKKDQIKDSSIVFVKDSNEIYTHGEEYQFVGWSILENTTSIFYVYDDYCDVTYGPYTFDNGMTGQEFYDSDYNNGSFIRMTETIGLTIDGFGYSLFGFDEIIEAKTYTISTDQKTGEPA